METLHENNPASLDTCDVAASVGQPHYSEAVVSNAGAVVMHPSALATPYATTVVHIFLGVLLDRRGRA